MLKAENEKHCNRLCWMHNMDDAYKRREKYVWYVRHMVMGGARVRDHNVQSLGIPIPFQRGLTWWLGSWKLLRLIITSIFICFVFYFSSGTFKHKLVFWRNFRRQLFGVQSNASVWMSYCVKELSWNWTQAVFVNVTFQTHLKHKLWLMVHFELWMPISLPFIFWLSVALSFTLFLRKCGCEHIHTSPSLPPIGFWEWTPRI